ncbi:7071_t:CDS:2, partial [Acaulospora colombiana]
VSKSTQLVVSLYIDQSLRNTEFHLRADYGTAQEMLYNPNPLKFASSGFQNVNVTIRPPPFATTTSPWGIAGDFDWKIILVANSQLVLPVKTSNWTTYVIQAAFQDFGFAYDTTNGAPRFGVGDKGGEFDLGTWTRSTNQSVRINCYDQAGIVQIGIGLAPNLSATWYYCEPFGFINTTKLVGIPQDCNNPFFKSNNTNPKVGNNDSQRTSFGNHAFTKIGQNIGDACAGPHLATEELP